MQKQLEKRTALLRARPPGLESAGQLAKICRIRYAPFHNEFLFNSIHQGSSAAPLFEDPGAVVHGEPPRPRNSRAPLRSLYALIMSDGGLNQMVLKNYSIEKINRHLESLQKMHLITFSTRSGAGKSRVWVFPTPPKSLPPPEPPAPSGPNPFEKV